MQAIFSMGYNVMSHFHISEMWISNFKGEWKELVNKLVDIK